MRFAAAAPALLAIVVGCAPDSEFAILRQDAAGLRTFSSDRLCEVYEDSRAPLIRQELLRRGAVRPAYWADIDGGVVRIGMTQTEMLCAVWPVAINVTVVAGLTSVQWRGGGAYFYTTNGWVTAIQY